MGTTWIEQLKLSTRTDVKADVKVTGDVIHALLYASTNTQLASAQYNSGTGTYGLWSAWPTLSSISLPNSEIATIDIDSTGRMWLATRARQRPPAIVVYHSASPYTTWNGPITLATGVIANDDIAAVTAPAGQDRRILGQRERERSASGSGLTSTGPILARGPPTKCPRPSRPSTAWGRAWPTTT